MQLEKQIYIDKDLPAGWKPYYIFLMKVNNEIVGRMTLREVVVKNDTMMDILVILLSPNFVGIIMRIKESS